MSVYVNNVSQLDEHSTWRVYDRGLRELTLLEAPKAIIKEYKYKASRECFLAFADLMLDGKLKVAPFHEIIASNFEAVANGDVHRLIVSCPPRSGKSMLSQVFVAWLLGRDEQTQHIIASYGQQLVTDSFVVFAVTFAISLSLGFSLSGLVLKQIQNTTCAVAGTSFRLPSEEC